MVNSVPPIRGGIVDDRQQLTQQVLDTVRRFVEREVMPVASRYEHADEYPQPLVERMKELGLFGATIPVEYGGLGLDYSTYSMIVEELCRGWMSLSGVLNTHLMFAYVLGAHGTREQKERYLPAMARGEHRAALCLTEPHAGSDTQRIRTTARRQGDHYVVNGSKMFITNARTATIYSLVVKTDASADPPDKGISLLAAEKDAPGLTIGRDIDKLGYKGIETCEVNFEDFRVPVANLVGGVEGRGLQQVLSGLEVGRINIASRAVGVAQAAFEDAIRYAQQRTAFGKPICEHQAIQLKLADMATKIEAARLLTRRAAAMKDRGERGDRAALARARAGRGGLAGAARLRRVSPTGLGRRPPRPARARARRRLRPAPRRRDRRGGRPPLPSCPRARTAARGVGDQ